MRILMEMSLDSLSLSQVVLLKIMFVIKNISNYLSLYYSSLNTVEHKVLEIILPEYTYLLLLLINSKSL